MKKCPNCSKTFEDSMRFCQSDGTPLVDDAPAVDPYATVVGLPVGAELSASAPEADELLDLPQNDPLKTMYVSDEELRSTMQGAEADDPSMELPPLEPSAPRFAEPDLASPDFGRMDPPAPSPIEPPVSNYLEPETVMQPEPPPSPFQSAPQSYGQTAEPTVSQQPYGEPFGSQQSSWTPPPAPVASWQDQQIGQSTPFQPPVARGEGENKTMAIISLVCGIAGILCCGLLSGIPAIVVGYIAKNNVDSNPQEYGGRGMAVAGMILGAISVVLSIVVIVLQIFLGVLGNLR